MSLKWKSGRIEDSRSRKWKYSKIVSGKRFERSKKIECRGVGKTWRYNDENGEIVAQESPEQLKHQSGGKEDRDERTH